MNQKGNVLLVVVLIFLVLGGFFIYQKRTKSVIRNAVSFITTFDECSKLTDSKIIQTYPRQCESKDGKTYIEEVKEPVNTANWQEFDTNLGFSFKCPPKWECSISDPRDFYVAKAYINSYVQYSIGFWIIKEKDFQQSPYRHPSYRNGVEWVKDLLAKNPAAVEVLPTAIRSSGGYEPVTDYPAYRDLKLDQIQEIGISGKKAVILGGKTIIPLNDEDLLIIEKGKENNTTVPLEKAIISSVKID